ncbi:putative nucleic acid-binding, contains PIN domain protein [Anoxybacillus amylolyticus]|uniref:Putative nucleic acid-binding, contains PIN domain protein n=1 Tax=Anoxybacteroides amylolyticum TaxID=294699 RepID=A0A160F3Y1_9BACL|nr:putative nucleic acid-binding, contains PIN domain protein [Anoxybacillus amylolyticus]
MKAVYKHEREDVLSASFRIAARKPRAIKKHIQMADQIDDVTREDTELAADMRRKARADHTR